MSVSAFGRDHDTQTDEAPSVSVVIPCHDNAATIGEQLAALVAQIDAPRFEVVIAANRCTDSTLPIVNGFSDILNLHIVSANEKAGVSYARNVGVLACHTDLILHLDADDAATPGWVAAMYEALQTEYLVGGRMLRPRPAWGGWHIEPGIYERDDLPISRGLRYALGSNLGYRREVWVAAGGFDELLVLGSDDVAFCLKAQRAGYRMAFARTAQVHYRARTTARESVRQRRHYGRGEAIMRLSLTPEQLRGPSAELVRAGSILTREAARLAVERDRRHRFLHMVGVGARSAHFARTWASGDWPTHRTGRRIYDVTLEDDLPHLGGRLWRVAEDHLVALHREMRDPGLRSAILAITPGSGLDVDGQGTGLEVGLAAAAVGDEGLVRVNDRTVSDAGLLAENLRRFGLDRRVTFTRATSRD